jgi:hypothetical protein
MDPMLDVHDATPRVSPEVPARSRRGGPWLVVLGAVLAALGIGGMIVHAMSQTAPRLAGVDQTRLDAFSTSLRPQATVCQTREVVPGDAAAVGLVLGTYGKRGQPVDITLTGGGATRSGHIEGGYGDGLRLVAPLSGPRAEVGAAKLCVRNAGDAMIALGGVSAPQRIVGRHETADVEARIAVTWWRPGQESYWSIAGPMAERAGRAKAGWVGTWTIWGVLGVVLATGILGVAVVARSARS